MSALLLDTLPGVVAVVSRNRRHSEELKTAFATAARRIFLDRNPDADEYISGLEEALREAEANAH